MSNDDKLFINKLDKAWEMYVHNQNAEISKLLMVKRRAAELFEALENNTGIENAILKLAKAVESHTKYRKWREEHDEKR